MGKISQRSPSERQDPAPLNDQQATVLDTLFQTTSKTETQPHPLAERLPDKIDFKTKTITRDKEGHYIMIKGSIQEEDTIVNCKKIQL